MQTFFAGDVQKCILFARKHKLQVTIRSAGQSYIGRSTADGSMMINMAAMDNIRVNVNDGRSDTGASADVQAGTPWASVYEEVRSACYLKYIYVVVKKSSDNR